MRALKHIDWACEEEGSEAVSKLVNRGVAIDVFFVMIGSISSDVRTGGFANLDNRGLRTYEKGPSCVKAGHLRRGWLDIYPLFGER
jgi:hypothetical protein